MIDGLKRSLGLNKRPNDGQAVKTLLETFRYPRLGPGMMWDAARDRIVERGGTGAHGPCAQAARRRRPGRLADDRDRAGRRPDDQGRATRSARRRCASSPRGSIRCPQTALEASHLKYRDFLTVALMIRSDDLFPDNWIYIHDSKVKVGRVQNFRSWSPEMVPDESVACVGLEYFCFEGDGLWSMADDDLVELAKREMDILGLVDPDKVIGGAVVRQEKAYPVYDEDYAANVAAMRAELEDKHPDAAPGRPQRHAPLQQPGPRDDDRDADGREHPRRRAGLRHLVRQRGRRIPRGGRRGRREGRFAAREPVTADQAAALASVRDVPRISARTDQARSGLSAGFARF